jgi:bifunctional non-homologous end joining protein LigD
MAAKRPKRPSAPDPGGLAEYVAKRDFERTPEPAGGLPKAGGAPYFCVQKHHATRLHYDFRLEVDGVLRSWAIPKGPSLDPAEKRFAARTENHPLEYGDFEGVIPEGNYGAGTVMLWDHGSWEHIGPTGDPAADLGGGKLDFRLHGQKLGGQFALVRMASSGGSRGGRRGGDGGEGETERGGDGKDWLLLKKKDDYARPGSDITREADFSVKSGLTLAEILSESPAVWNPATRRILEAIRPPVDRAPMPGHVAPMLATLVKSLPRGEDWLYELKHDGVRVIAYVDRLPADVVGEEAARAARVRLQSRSGRNQTALYPEIAAALGGLNCDQAILDGEIVALDASGRSSFQRLQPRMAAHPREVERLKREIPVAAFLFDLLYLDGYDLRRLAVEKRKEVLAALLGDGPAIIQYSDHVVGQGDAFFQLAKELEVEGVIAKREGSGYSGRRSTSWLKIKRVQDLDFVVGGFTAPQGSRPHFGALIVGLYAGDGTLRYVTRVGSGFDDAALSSLYAELTRRERPESPFAPAPAIKDARWVAPELVARVRFTEWTNDGGLRAPVFMGLVPEAAPEECRVPEKEPPLASAVESAAPDPGDAVEVEEAVEPNPNDAAAGEEVREAASPPAPAAAAERARSARFVDHAPGPREVRLANPDKVLFPEDGITKRELFAYFELVAPVLLEHIRDRPLSLQRWPNGIHAPSFFQKEAPQVLPPFVRTEPILHDEGRKVTRYVVADNVETILWLANLTAFTIHPWGSRVGSLHEPDFMILDLDPKEAPFTRVIDVALELKSLLEGIGLRGYPKTTGSSGLHIYVPLEPRYDYEQVRTFAEVLGRILAARMPAAATIEMKVDKRGGRIFLDHLRNQLGQTAAGPYVVRALPGAPVSAPLRWEEVDRDRLSPRQFTIRNFAARFRDVGDLWEPVLTDKQQLEDAFGALEGLLAGE